MLLRRQQRGDTIIEVLIAIAVASAVLGGAYAFTNRTTKGTLQSQEHAEATRLVESQIEQLKAYVEAGNTVSASFCFDPTTGYKGITPCPVSTTGSADAVQYQITITSEPGGGRLGGAVYTALAEWPSVNGGTDRVEMVYKAYP